MEWTFESMLKKYSDPFSSQIIKVESTIQRPDCPSCTIESLSHWIKGAYYAIGDQAYFLFEFKNAAYVFTKYKLHGITTACSPYWWDVLGSMDNKTYFTLHSVTRALCSISHVINSECSETFDMSTIEKVRYVKGALPERR